MIWVIASRCVSLFCVAIQLAVFGNLLPDHEVTTAYSRLALIAAVSQFSIALPLIFCGQSVWLEPHQRRKVVMRSFVSAVISAAVLAALVIVISGDPGFSSNFALIFAIAILSALPNLYAMMSFAAGQLPRGAGYASLNVALPQMMAAAAAYFGRSALAWLVGLGVGHFLALIIVAIHARWAPGQASEGTGTRAPLALNRVLIAATAVSLAFSWAVPNLPRVALPGTVGSNALVAPLMAATIAFAGVNTIETLIVQARRSEWLRHFEIGRPILWTKTPACEIGLIIGLHSIGWALLSALLAFGFPIAFPELLPIPTTLIMLLCGVEVCRGATNSLYAMKEAARNQKPLIFPIALATAAFGTGCFLGAGGGLMQFYGLALLTLGTATLANVVIALRWATKHESQGANGDNG